MLLRDLESGDCFLWESALCAGPKMLLLKGDCCAMFLLKARGNKYVLSQRISSDLYKPVIRIELSRFDDSNDT